MRRLAAAAALLLIGGCASLPDGYERVESHALVDTGSTRLALAGRDALAAHPGQSAFRPLPNAMDALVARIILTEARRPHARHAVLHLARRRRPAARSPRRCCARRTAACACACCSTTSARTRTTDVLLALDSHPNVEVRLFNPVASRSFKTLGSALEFFRVNRRMHNKALIADNQGAILGGRNIGDEYFGAHRRPSRSAISTCSCTARSCAKCRRPSTNTGTRRRRIRSTT